MALEENISTQKPDNGIPNIMNIIQEGVSFFLKRWWIFAIAGLIGGTAGFFYAGSKKPDYKSHLTFALDEGDGSMGNIMSLASQFGLNLGGGSSNIFSGDNILEVMKSRRMIERVLLSVDTIDSKPSTLIEYYFAVTGSRKDNPNIQNIHFPAGQLISSFSYQQDSLLYATYQSFANNNITAQRPDRKLSIYEVNVISPNEIFTKVFTDRIVKETNNFYIEIRTKKAKETLDILSERTATMKGNLNSSITNKASIQDVNVNPAFAEAQVPVQKQQSNIQVYGAAYAELFKNLEMARFQYLNAIPLMQIIDPADYPMEKIKISRLMTAITWAFISAFLALFIFWLRRVIRYKPNPTI